MPGLQLPPRAVGLTDVHVQQEMQDWSLTASAQVESDDSAVREDASKQRKKGSKPRNWRKRFLRNRANSASDSDSEGGEEGEENEKEEQDSAAAAKSGRLARGFSWFKIKAALKASSPKARLRDEAPVTSNRRASPRVCWLCQALCDD
jgi:hypothetical protein